MARLARTWAWIHAVSLVVILGVLVVANRGQWFFGDEWDFILFRGLHHPIWGLLRPHNEHWSTLPILWWRATFAVFGLHTYWPYLCGLFAVHLVVVHALWRLMRRARVSPALATGVAVVFGLFGPGAENLSWAFQVGFVGSLAAGLLLLLAVDERGSRRRVGAVAVAAVVSLMLSGISVVMVVATGIAALARWGWRKAAVATAPAAVVYLVWLKLYGSVGLTGTQKNLHGSPKDIPKYVWGGMANTLGGLFKSPRVGEALLVALLVVLALRGRALWRGAPVLVALAAAAPVMFAVISQGRGAIPEPNASRYLYLCAAMLLPLVAVAVQDFVRGNEWRGAVALAVCLVLSVVGTIELVDNLRLNRTIKLTLRGQILAALPVAATEPIVNVHPDFTYAGDITVAKLRRLDQRGNLPHVTPTVANVAYARLALEVAVDAKPAPTRFTATAPIPPGATVDAHGVCARVDLHGANAVITRTAPKAVFSLTPSVSGRALTFVPYLGGNAGPRFVGLRAGRRVTMHEVLPTFYVIQLPGPATFCGVQWTRP